MSNPPSATTIYLLRHGATSYNLETPPRLQGSGINVGLSKVGQAQAARAAHALAEIPFSAIYSSPLLRASETAQAIAARQHPMEIQTEADLREINVGRWEGKSWAMIERDDPEGAAHYWADPGEHGYPGGENFRQLAERMLAAFTGIAERHTGQRILIVGHGMANCTLLSSLLGIPLKDCRRVPHENCGINIIRIHKGETRLVTLNSTLHLEGC